MDGGVGLADPEHQWCDEARQREGRRRPDVADAVEGGDPGAEPERLEHPEGSPPQPAVSLRRGEDAPQRRQGDGENDPEDPAAGIGIDAEPPGRCRPESDELEGERHRQG